MERCLQRKKELVECKEQERRAEGDEQRICGFLPKPPEKQSGGKKTHGVHSIDELIHGRLLDEFPNETDEQGRYGEERRQSRGSERSTVRQYDEVENDEQVVDREQHEAGRRP